MCSSNQWHCRLEQEKKTVIPELYLMIFSAGVPLYLYEPFFPSKLGVFWTENQYILTCLIFKVKYNCYWQWSTEDKMKPRPVKR